MASGAAAARARVEALLAAVHAPPSGPDGAAAQRAAGDELTTSLIFGEAYVTAKGLDVLAAERGGDSFRAHFGTHILLLHCGDAGTEHVIEVTKTKWLQARGTSPPCIWKIIAPCTHARVIFDARHQVRHFLIRDWRLDLDRATGMELHLEGITLRNGRPQQTAGPSYNAATMPEDRSCKANGVYMTNAAHFNATDSVFTDNDAGGTGGAVALMEGGCTSNIANSRFWRNTARGDGEY
eukprot:gene33676-21483_t